MHIREQIQRIAGTFGIDLVQKLTCTVNTVNIDNRSCLVTPQNRGIGQLSAFLMAETDDGILVIPSKNSTVKVLYSRLNAATVIQYSAIDSILWRTGTNAGNGIQLEGNSYGGLVKIVPLISKLKSYETDLNNLKQDLQALITALLPITSPLTGAALSGAMSTALMGYIAATFDPYTQQSDLENTLVQHGDGS